jgi:hypothetical protein
MEDFDDGPMADLLRRWGQKARAEGGGAPAGAAPDLEALHRALGRVDAEQVFAPRAWWRPAVAVAACVLIGVLVWSWSPAGETGLPALSGTPPRLLDTALSPLRDPVRGQPAARFSVGDPLWVQYFAERPGFALVALLQPPDTALRLTPAPVALSLDGEPLGPFTLRGEPGLAGLLVVTSAEAPRPEQERRILDAAAAALRAARPAGGDELREAVLAAFRDARGLSASCVPFDLGPR